MGLSGLVFRTSLLLLRPFDRDLFEEIKENGVRSSGGVALGVRILWFDVLKSSDRDALLPLRTGQEGGLEVAKERGGLRWIGPHPRVHGVEDVKKTIGVFIVLIVFANEESPSFGEETMYTAQEFLGFPGVVKGEVEDDQVKAIGFSLLDLIVMFSQRSGERDLGWRKQGR